MDGGLIAFFVIFSIAISFIAIRLYIDLHSHPISTWFQVIRQWSEEEHREAEQERQENEERRRKRQAAHLELRQITRNKETA